MSFRTLKALANDCNLTIEKANAFSVQIERDRQGFPGVLPQAGIGQRLRR